MINFSICMKMAAQAPNACSNKPDKIFHEMLSVIVLDLAGVQFSSY